jgi:hypothetical protein
MLPANIQGLSMAFSLYQDPTGPSVMFETNATDGTDPYGFYFWARTGGGFTFDSVNATTGANVLFNLGTAANIGTFEIRHGIGAGTKMWKFTPTGLQCDPGSGSYATFIAATRPAVTNLSNSFGTGDDTIADVTGTYNQTILNNNFRDLSDKINAILTALKSTHGLIT